MGENRLRPLVCIKLDTNLSLSATMGCMKENKLKSMVRELKRAGYTAYTKGAVGRPAIPTPCRKCGTLCPSARHARAHCARKDGDV